MECALVSNEQLLVISGAMMTQAYLSLALGAYFLGSMPFGYIIPKLVRGIDIRDFGSGNIGATNVVRTLGKKWGVLVFFLDVMKGFVPALIGLRIGGPTLGAVAGLAAVVGHNWSYFLSFRGGKGIATSCGIFLAVFPLGVLIAFASWVLCLKITRYVSVSSMLGAIVLFACAFILQKDPLATGLSVTILCGVAALLCIVRHKKNIVNLLNGTENKTGKG